MQIPAWTVDEMLAEGPCRGYARERLRELWAGRGHLTLVDILDLDIHVADKVWVCCRATALREPWLERVVARAVTDHALKCGVPAVEQWAQRWLSGEDRTKARANAAQVATHSAAECATRAAANAAEAADWSAYAAARAAWSAVRAAGAAADYAAWDAAEAEWWDAWAAANVAANVAANAAAGAEQERERQVLDMREVIAEMCEGG